MCRDVAIFLLNEILDDIHEDKSPAEIKGKCETFKEKYDFEGLNLEEQEVRKDRLKEYIKFFNISYVCEYDIFERREMFYDILKENLDEESWKSIEAFLEQGNLLLDYQI